MHVLAHGMPAWLTYGLPCHNTKGSALLLGNSASTCTYALCRARAPRTTRSTVRASGVAAGADAEDATAAARKRAVRTALESAAPHIVDKGWGALVRWRDPLLARNVEMSTPFVPELEGRTCAHIVLSLQH
eukprot:IDg14977t1